MSQKKWSEIEAYEDLEEKKRRFADWLATPEPMRDIKSQIDLAEELNTNPETLTRWKYKKPFIDIVQNRKKEIIGIDGLNKVLDSLMVRASNTSDNTRDANDAAELFLNWYYNQDFTKGTKVKQTMGSGNKGLKIEIDEAREHDEDSSDDELDDAFETGGSME